MKSLKILLAHPRHNTVGAHSSYVPINIGYIAAYLKKEVSEIDIEFKLEVDPEDIFKGIENWKNLILVLKIRGYSPIVLIL